MRDWLAWDRGRVTFLPFASFGVGSTGSLSFKGGTPFDQHIENKSQEIHQGHMSTIS